MRIVEFDGTTVLYEAFTPPLTPQQMDERDQQRRMRLLEEAGFTPTWTTERVVSDGYGNQVNWPGIDRDSVDWFAVPAAIITTWMEERAGDERENRGWRRHDGKPVYKRHVRQDIEKIADQFGIPTNEPGWQEATLQALQAAPAKGTIGKGGVFSDEGDE